MKLDKKKQLAARTLNVGKNRIIFVQSRLDEIKEAITKQDIRDLHKGGAIIVKKVKGRKKVGQKNKNRTPGNIRKKINKRKQDYVKMTRKLRVYISELKNQKRLTVEQIREIRKKIRNRVFKSKASLKEYIGGLK